VDLVGEWDDLNSLRGSGKIQSVLLGAKGTPMTNKQPVDVKWEKGLIKVSPFLLVGKDSQLESELTYQYPKEVKLRVDGKWDLELVQPFIPGLEMGSGKVSTSIRWTGKPDELQMLGNISLEDGAFRLTGIADDFKAVQVQMSLIQDKINIDKFSALMNGGEVKVTGDVRFPKFKELIPSLRILSDRVLLKQGNYLGVRYSGDMKLTGTEAPYLLSGSCRIHEANLTSFEIPEDKGPQKDPILRWDIKCEGKEKLFVNTSVMNAEFKGDLNLLGNNVQMGLLGNLESTRGSILFRERRFNLNSGTVKFEAPNKILPRFNISSRATVQETSTTTAGQTKPGQNYEVSLQVYGIPSSYKILLTSTPSLAATATTI
jgi:translocation and assembly module TamB